MTLDAKDLSKVFSYDPETGVISRKINFRKYKSAVGVACGSKDGFGHLSVTHKGVRILSHRLAFFLMTGDWPTGLIDHINGQPSDNRWSNLRECSKAENTRHQKVHKSNTSGYRGVSFVKSQNRWRAIICVNGKNIYLGQFRTIEEAVSARASGSAKYHGEFSGYLVKEDGRADR
jgi:HNH endonuclease/AP2 domain